MRSLCYAGLEPWLGGAGQECFSSICSGWVKTWGRAGSESEGAGDPRKKQPVWTTWVAEGKVGPWKAGGTRPHLLLLILAGDAALPLRPAPDA